MIYVSNTLKTNDLTMSLANQISIIATKYDQSLIA